ncbi:MAG: hypothetical protein AB2990_03440 [Candidatus Symbiodolus clandestinus]
MTNQQLFALMTACLVSRNPAIANKVAYAVIDLACIRGTQGDHLTAMRAQQTIKQATKNVDFGKNNR